MINPSGMIFNEYYLYADKAFEIIPSGVSNFILASGVHQNAPVVITEASYLTNLPEDPWAQIDGSGKWDEKAMGSLSLDPSGSYDAAKKEFYMDPAASGRIFFNQITSKDLYVEYEGGDASYYYVENVDVNPMMREAETGFLQITQATQIDDVTYMSLTASQSVVKSDGFDRSLLTATLWDKNLNKISNKTIVFEMIFNDVYLTTTGSLIPGNLDGHIYRTEPSTALVCETTAVTDYTGKCTATFLSNAGQKGSALIKAYYLSASGVYDTVTVTSYDWDANIFTLDISMLDGLDYLL